MSPEPRPFYVIGHNPNTIEDAENALKQGANALEPDINLFNILGFDLPILMVCHDRATFNLSPGKWPTLEKYLDGLRDLVARYPQLALVVFDCKPPVATAAYGQKILTAIREHLTDHVKDLNVIISVGTRDDKAIFDTFLSGNSPLREREGVMIDGENDVVGVTNFFRMEKKVSGHIGYGNGTMGVDVGWGPNVQRSIEVATGLRAKYGDPNFTYAFAVNEYITMHDFINRGVDGIISDDLSLLYKVVAERSDVRLASRQDFPFLHYPAFCLEVKTSDVAGAGTNADLTFTINGTKQSVAKTVRGIPYNLASTNDFLFEKGDVNYVNIPSDDLGTLVSLTVQNDGSGVGPDWNLDYIELSSKTWMSSKVKRAYFNNKEVNKSTPATSPLYPVAVQITWPTPKDIVYGTRLSNAQHGAVAKSVYSLEQVPGNYSYSFQAGMLLGAGVHALKVKFHPDDFSVHEFLHHEEAEATVHLTVLKAEPTVTASGGVFTFNEGTHVGSGDAVGGAGEPLEVKLMYEGTTEAGEVYGPIETPPTDAGKYIVIASTPGNENNNPGSNLAELTIKPAKAKVLAVEALRLRKGPSIHANVLDWLRHDDVVNVISTRVDEDGKWAQISPGQWSSIWYKEKTWMEFIQKERERG